MDCSKQIAEGLYWIGAEDRRITLFEGIHPVDHGMSYNSYLLIDEKTVLIDCMDRALEERFLLSIRTLLDGRELDHIIVNHIEPDHSATLGDVMRLYPSATVLCTKACKKMVGQFLGQEYLARVEVVADGDSLDTGSKTLGFATAPMVHWPEVMVTYDATDRILFSADAFGTFGTIDGELYDDQRAWEDMLPEMRRYYANIVGKYGTQTSELLAKMDTLEVDLICPLHGPLLRTYIPQVVDVYRKWAAYEPEDQGVLIAYASIYGGTRDAAERLAFALSDAGVHDLALYDLSMTDVSHVLADAFRCSNIVMASVTYNAGIFPKMAEFVRALGEHNLRRRNFSIIQNGSWGPIAGKRIREILEDIPEARFVGDLFTIKSRLKPEQLDEFKALAQAIADSVLDPQAFQEPQETRGEVAQTPIVGASRPAKAVPVAPGVATRSSAAGGAAGAVVAPPLAPPPAYAGAVGAGAVGTGVAGGFAAGVDDGDEEDEGPRIIQIWRCTYCGYQLEIEKGRPFEWETFECPICYHRGEDLFMLIREKVMPR